MRIIKNGIVILIIFFVFGCEKDEQSNNELINEELIIEENNEIVSDIEFNLGFVYKKKYESADVGGGKNLKVVSPSDCRHDLNALEKMNSNNAWRFIFVMTENGDCRELLNPGGLKRNPLIKNTQTKHTKIDAFRKEKNHSEKDRNCF